MNKFLIISLAVNLILLVVVGWVLLDMGVLKAQTEVSNLQNQVLVIQNQTNLSTTNIQQIIGVLKQVKIIQ